MSPVRRRKSDDEEASLFDELDDNPERPKYDWNWWDPWPEELSMRDGFLMQIRRDMRALKEREEEEDADLYTRRIEGFRKLVELMDAKEKN